MSFNFNYRSSSATLRGGSAAQMRAALNEAILFHQKGQLQNALPIYESLLKAQPANSQVLHLLGLIAAQTGQFEKAVDLIGRAIEIFPGNADFYVNLGNAQKSLKQLDAAIACFDQAISLVPGHAQAYCNRGVALQELGSIDAAVDSYRQAIAIKPDYAEAHSNCGLALHQLRRLDESLVSYERAIAIAPGFAEAHFFRGNVLLELQQMEAAIASYDKAIALKPSYAQAYFNRGFGLQELKHFDAAIASYDKAIASYAEYAEAHCNRGVVLIELKQFDAAVTSCDRAIAIKPTYAEAYFNRGNALLARKQFDEALTSYDLALTINPRYSKAHANRAFALHHLKQLEAALTSYDTSIEIFSGSAETHSNRGLVLHELNRMDDALSSYDRAITTDPEYAEAYFNMSLTYLVCGLFHQGWALYEWRLKAGGSELASRNFSEPVWSGELPLVGKKILLHSEQGFGDTIQFSRYAVQVASLGANVLLEVPEPLLGVLYGLGSAIELVERGKPLPAFDYHCSLLSLPLAFNTDAMSIPARQSYLRGERAKVMEWSQRLGLKTRPRIGIVWSGNADHVNDHNRSIPLSALMASLPDTCEYVSLQKEVRASDRRVLESHSEIRHFGEALKDFGDTAALCDLMDLVVSVDTSVAHLSGAVGRPTWILLPHVPDWRWLLDRDESPWYPSVKLYRQASDREWAGVLGRLHIDLRSMYPFENL